MSSFADSMRVNRVSPLWVVGGLLTVMFLAAVSIANLRRSGISADKQGIIAREQGSTYLAEPNTVARMQNILPVPETAKADSVPKPTPEAAAGRKIIRTSSLELIVQHPAEIADQIAALAEKLGGYLVSANSGGHEAKTAVLTVRVPASRFDEARGEIRKLGLRVESEKIEAQDVTRQYVDQDAGIRNLRAEESQYLTILKQASTVKDLLAVSAKLSEVRGQIEQQQAEFNTLSQQIETVAIAISLRTEAEAQVFGLNWRPVYELKLAMRDGLESIASYATAMATILFYLPAAILWVGTLLATALIGWRTFRWVGRRWLGWSASDVRIHG